jgi:hypothetical protein
MILANHRDGAMRNLRYDAKLINKLTLCVQIPESPHVFKATRDRKELTEHTAAQLIGKALGCKLTHAQVDLVNQTFTSDQYAGTFSLSQEQQLRHRGKTGSIRVSTTF